MPLTEADVRASLTDVVTQKMDFWVDSVHVSGRLYHVIHEHIRAGNILVAEGDGVLAFYDNKTDVLTTQKGTSPANVFQRAQLLHECTHALVDVFNQGAVTRHIDELASYVAQFVYTMRSDPAVVPPGDDPWTTFYRSVESLVKTFGLQTVAGNGKKIGVVDLEPVRVLLAGLPNVNYGSFKKESPSGADGLIRNNPFLTDGAREVKLRKTSIPLAVHPDPTDDDLIHVLEEKYAASDVAGYGKRLRKLRRDFALCSLGRAKALHPRLVSRRRGDRVSELFHDRLSAAGRAILLRVLRQRI